MKIARIIALNFAVAASFFAAAAPTVRADFDLQFDFGTEAAEFTQSQLDIFDDVEAEYERLITGYQPGVNLVGAVIDVSADPIDGPFDFGAGTGFVAGQGGGSAFSNNPTPGGFEFFNIENTPAGDVTTGFLSLDEDDLSTIEGFTDALFNVIFHEVGHALGLGTLWNANGLLDANGQYTGANGLAEYQLEFGVTDTAIPTDGTTAFNAGHWDETSLLGTDVFSPTLLLGGNNPISDTSIASFADLGFTTVLAIPEPGSAAILSLAGLFFAATRRKRTS